MKINKDSKLFLKISSALVAVALWFAITYTEDPVISQYLSDIQIVFEGEDRLLDNGLIITNKESLPALSAVISGNRSSVISSIRSVSAVADVSGIQAAGTNTVQIKYSYPTYAVTLARSKTEEITIETEKVISRRIPVRIEQSNSDKNEEHIIKSQLTEQEILVRGAESVINRISYAKAVVDATNIVQTSSQEYFYKFYDKDGDLVADDDIIYKEFATVSVENEVYKRAELAVKVVLTEELSGEYALKVKNLSAQAVKAGVPEDSELTEIFAYFAGGRSEDDVYKLKLDVPEGVYLPEDSRTVTAQCELVPKVVKELEVPVTAINIPEGKKAKITPAKIKITAKGAEDALSADKIKATVDAKEITTAGGAPVHIEAQDGITVIGAYSAAVTIE